MANHCSTSWNANRQRTRTSRLWCPTCARPRMKGEWDSRDLWLHLRLPRTPEAPVVTRSVEILTCVYCLTFPLRFWALSYCCKRKSLISHCPSDLLSHFYFLFMVFVCILWILLVSFSADNNYYFHCWSIKLNNVVYKLCERSEKVTNTESSHLRSWNYGIFGKFAWKWLQRLIHYIIK